MAWGVFPDKYMVCPPGTINLQEKDDVETATEGASLKKRGNIILQPQPSDSPNDPLNWSKRWKYTSIMIIIVGASTVSATSQMLTPGLPILAKQLGVSLDLITSVAVGSIPFWTAAASCFTSSSSKVWGRRPFYVISLVILSVANLGTVYSKSFPVFAFTRAIAGIASGPLFTAVTGSIADTFFTHERGVILAIVNAALFIGSILGQVIAGSLIDKLGVNSTFAFAAVSFGILIPLTYFLVLESLFVRPILVEKVTHDDLASLEGQEVIREPHEIHQTYKAQLAIFRGRITNYSFWKGVAKPVILTLFPINLYGALSFGAYFAAFTVLILIAATTFSMPPYNLSPTQVGLTNLPLLGTSLIGSFLFGWLSDVSAKFMSGRNKVVNGMYEPEYRLTLMLIATPLGVISLIGFGLSVSNSLPIAWPITWMCVFNLSTVASTQAAVTYVIDCYPTEAASAFSGINLFSSVFTFLASAYINGWVETSGPVVVFNCFAAIVGVVFVMTIPQYVFGKRIRSFMARNKWTR